jgi:ankyrin repeat protein
VKNICFLLCALTFSLTTQAFAQTSQREQLSKAIWSLNTDAVRSLLNGGVSVKTRDAEGFVPLVSTVIAGSQPNKELIALEIAQLLLKAGADVNQDGPVGTTPLAAACSQTDSIRIVEFLIERGADVNAKGYNGTTPLYQAVRKGRGAMAEVLIEHGANVRAKNTEDQTVLHYAVLNNMRDTVEMLIARGAEINARDNDGKTPLSWSLGKIPTSFIGSTKGVPMMTELLRQKGASE